ICDAVLLLLRPALNALTDGITVAVMIAMITSTRISSINVKPEDLHDPGDINISGRHRLFPLGRRGRQRTNRSHCRWSWAPDRYTDAARDRPGPCCRTDTRRFSS